MRTVVLALLIALIAGSASAKSRDPIRIATGMKPAQQIVALIASRALKKSGFRFEMVSIRPDLLGEALTNGNVHVLPAAILSERPGLSDRIAADEVRALGGLIGNGRDEDIQKLVWPGMKRKWPNAQKMLKRMVLRPEVIADLVRGLRSGASAEDVAATWWKANKKTWSPWIAASKNWMKP
ncbi:MAG: glycine betaine ABC transporter substrate-binding protein [Pseudomonadota bacterium]